MTLERYAALALQLGCHAINAVTEPRLARQHRLAGIARAGLRIAASKRFIGSSLRLVVLPEYFLTGYPQGETLAAWKDKACVEPEGVEYEALGRIAQEAGVYLCGNWYETDPHFPEIYFQTSFILDDSGKVLLRYRRLLSMFGVTPYDVLDAYLDRYGADSLFPVVDTPLGKLAALASEEILYPEICRALALGGAELICHSSSEVASPRPTPKHIARLARSHENHVYLVSANTAGITGSDMPEHSVDQGSAVVDHQGRVLAEAAAGESMVAWAVIDIEAQRHHRRQASMFNLFSRQRLQLFGPVYANAKVYPANTLLGEDGQVRLPDRRHFLDTQQEVIERLISKGIL